MKHLTMDKIIKFISFTEMNESNMKLAAEVNLHMIECPECRKKISDIHTTLEKLLNYSHTDHPDSSGTVIDEDIQDELADFYDGGL